MTTDSNTAGKPPSLVLNTIIGCVPPFSKISMNIRYF